MSDSVTVDRGRLNDFLLSLIGATSVSTHEGEAAKVLRAELDRLGFDTEIDDIGNVIASLDLGPGPTVLLDSHMDTVVVPDPTVWTRDPRGQLDGNRIYGRGSVDMKGPMAACVQGVAALRESHRAGRIVVCGTVAEELVEGPALVRVAEQVRPDFVVICEATSRRVARGQRGRAEVRVEVRGRSCHSAHPRVGLNAAEVMADVIAALREVPTPDAHPVLGEGILVLTDVMSRPYPGLSVVPDLCVATFDRRTLPGETEDDVLRPVREIVNDVAKDWGTTAEVSIALDEYVAYTGTEVTAPNFAPSWIMDEDAPIVTSAVAGLEAAGLDAVVGHYAFCTNGSGTAGVLGIPTIGYGPGEEHVAHSVDESIDVDDLYLGALGYAAIVKALTEQGGPA